MPRLSKPRAVLTESQAVSIMDLKGKASSFDLAPVYGVSEKAIRDIWSGRTWSKSFHKLHHVNDIWQPDARQPPSTTMLFVQSSCPESGSELYLSPNSRSEDISGMTAIQYEMASIVVDVDRLLNYWDQGYAVLLPAQHPLISDPNFWR